MTGGKWVKIILLHGGNYAFMGNETAGICWNKKVLKLLCSIISSVLHSMNRHVEDYGLMRNQLMKRCTLSAIVWAGWSYALGSGISG